MIRFIIFTSLIVLLGNCNQRRNNGSEMTQKEIDDRLMEINEQMTGNEKNRIDAFVEKKSWPLEETGTGLRYWIYEDAEGETGKRGQTAEISFVITLLDGTECYRTEGDNTRKFRIEQSDVESGLHEAIQYLSAGDKAKVILPSHLAYGLAGDMNKIPLKSTLVYDIELHSLR
ncbi:MAG: hypothetical protein HKN45_11385 [Flavobacteriales bacterium]|nr:hypothetical protein [Flavobacteriales bacterium]NNK81276.1 hypothetical protein [Flavobacteriales bacterium]